MNTSAAILCSSQWCCQSFRASLSAAWRRRSWRRRQEDERSSMRLVPPCWLEQDVEYNLLILVIFVGYQRYIWLASLFPLPLFFAIIRYIVNKLHTSILLIIIDGCWYCFYEYIRVYATAILFMVAPNEFGFQTFGHHLPRLVLIASNLPCWPHYATLAYRICACVLYLLLFRECSGRSEWADGQEEIAGLGPWEFFQHRS